MVQIKREEINQTGVLMRSWAVRIGILFLIFLLFFVSIEMMTQSLSVLGKGVASQLIQAAGMPFIAIFIGLLATAILQSSSSVTSIAVAMVASQSINLSMGIFIILGANIGTTLTSNIVSLGFITNRSSFRKAISAATIHDFFNMIMVLIIFPLEYYYRLLSKISHFFASLFTIPGDVEYSISHTGIFWLSSIAGEINEIIGNNWIVLIFSIILLIASIKVFSTYSYNLIIGESKDKLKSFIFDNPVKSFSWGLLITGALQSSSITTSLAVPLVATRKITLEAVFPFILGANIGTTITALLAAIFKSEAAISLAMAHLLFNSLGVAIFLPFAKVRSLPVLLAKEFGNITSKSRLLGLFYIIITFFIIPFILIYLSQRV